MEKNWYVMFYNDLKKRFNVVDLRPIVSYSSCDTIFWASLGHWQKILHGKRVRVVELPTDYTGENSIELEIMTESTQRRSSPAQDMHVLQHEIESTLFESLEVPSKLTKPHVLIIVAKARLEEILEREYSIMRPSYKSGEVLDIFVSKNKLGRALRLFDTLIKVLYIRNHSVEIRYNTTEVILFGEHIELKLREKFKKITDGLGKWDSTKYVPTGVLYLTSYRYPEHTWADGKLPLEKQLANILAYLEIKGKKLHEESLERETENKVLEEKKRLQKEVRIRQDAELNDFRFLLKKVERWQQLKLIRGYIEELEARSMENGHLSKDINDWIAWARKKADW